MSGAEGREQLNDTSGYGDRPWRTGRKVGRTVYDAHDRLIGVMDTPLLAQLVVTGVNALDAEREQANPLAVPLDAVWSELTREQIDNLTHDVADLCRANHEALHHPPGWDDPHRFADKP